MYSADENVRWHSCSGKQAGSSQKIICTSMLIYDHELVPFLRNIPKGLKPYVHTKLVLVFIVVLFIIAER